MKTISMHGKDITASWNEENPQYGGKLELKVVTDARPVSVACAQTSVENGNTGTASGSGKLTGTLAFFVEGSLPQVNPGVDPPLYLDPQEGARFALQLSKPMRITGVYQHKQWWTRPFFTDQFAEIPDRSQLVLLEYQEFTVCLLAICGDIYRTDLRGTEDGSGVTVRLSSNERGRRTVESPALVMTWGTDPYDCISRAGERAVRLVGHPEMLRKNRRYPAVFEKLGWCTWDAFYHEVSAQGITEKLEELKAKKIPVQWVLIDDGWSEVDYETSRLKTLDADPVKFPEGLSGIVRRIKKDYRIPYVGVWHAVTGYWSGLEKDSPADRCFAGNTATTADGRILPAPDRRKAYGFYDTWHGYLKSHCDIDFVKVDGQSNLTVFYEGHDSCGRVSNEIQNGLNASAAVHFDNAIINCMGMAPEDVWHRPSSMVTRTSDDFVPRVPHGFREHAIQNAYSSLWTGLFYTGDWDMFFSEHPENRQNSILRAISGGPVYTSDAVGHSDPAYLLPLVLSDGTVLRCDGIGLPTRDSLFRDPVGEGGAALKIFNHRDGVYYIAAFNIRRDEASCKARISVNDIPVPAGRRWTLFDETAGATAPLAEGRDYVFALAPNDAGMFAIYPEAEITVLGLAGKYIAGGSVKVFGDGRKTIFAEAKDTGTLIFTATMPVSVSDQNGKEISVSEKNGTLTFSAVSGVLYRITALRQE